VIFAKNAPAAPSAPIPLRKVIFDHREISTSKLYHQILEIMTTREYLNRARKRSCILAMPGIALFVYGLNFEKNQDSKFFILLFAFAICIVATLLPYFFCKCLQCRAYLGVLSNQSRSTPWKISDDLHYCPYCSHSLDHPVSGENKGK
jgi:hypothetical protein